MTDPLVIDGAHGEGGGQIVRTATTLAALTGRPVRIINIRAKRRNPGLAAQHLTAVRALAALCGGELHGDALGATRLDFVPLGPPQPSTYVFDVGAAREGGSAGATTLVLQAVLLPLALADGLSRVTIRGGTHMAWSPPYDYIADVYLPTLARLGIRARPALMTFGWYPAGQGEITVDIDGLGAADGRLANTLRLTEPGPLRHVFGRAVAANLPAHIPQRMADRARRLLADLDPEARIVPLRVRAASPGAGLFLTAAYDHGRCGFSALGARGVPSEDVAAQAVDALIAHHDSGAVVDPHLADQILVAMALAREAGEFTTSRITDHLVTNAWVIERFGLATIDIEAYPKGFARVSITPAGNDG